MRRLEYIYGTVLCITIAIFGTLLSKYIHIGSVSLAIVLGIIIGNSVKLTDKFQKGITFSEKHILSFAIAFLGVNLDYKILSELGYKTILIIIFAMVITISSSILFAKIFKLRQRFALLLAIGNGVCGSSAIAATEQIVGAKKEEIGLSVAVVNFLGTIGIFLLPFIAKIVLHFTNINSGVLIGNTLQAVGQVVAAGFSLGESAGQTATIVKMTRILMLTPLIFILLFIFSKKGTPKKDKSRKLEIKVPLFIVGFILFSFIPTFQLLPKEQIEIISKMSHYALIIAMAGIGLKISFGSILKDGRSALLVGGLIFVVQILLSTALIVTFLNS